MIGVLASQRPVRLFLAGCVCIGGWVLGELLRHQGSFGLAMAVFSVSLAALVGMGKLASP